MPKRRVDPVTGAVIYTSTPEDKEKRLLFTKIQALEQRVLKLEQILMNLGVDLDDENRNHTFNSKSS